MPGEVRHRGGVAKEAPALQSGKFSSILAYLDHVSEDARVHDKANMFGAGASSSPSLSPSTTSSSRQTRSSRPFQYSGGEESKLGRGGTRRAPWDNSIKDRKAKAVTTAAASPTRHSHCRGAQTTGVGQGGASPAAGKARRNHGASSSTAVVAAAAAAAASGGNSPTRSCRARREDAKRRSSNAADSEHSPSSDTTRISDGSRDRGGFDETLDYGSSSAAGGEEAPTTAVVGGIARQQRPRRWVWDEWGDDEVGDRSPPSPLRDKGAHRSSRRSTPAELANRSSGRRRSPNELAARPPVAGDAAAGELHSSSKGNEAADLQDDSCTPAARKAFEDVQATARSMKAILKEKRSEV